MHAINQLSHGDRGRLHHLRRVHLPFLKIGNILQRCLRNSRQGLLRKESLTSGDNDIWKGQQMLKQVIFDNLIREILKKQIALLLIHIHRQPAHMTTLERVDYRPSIDQRAAAGIYEQKARLRQGYGVCVYQMSRL